MLRFSGERGECFPSAKKIGDEIGVGERRARVYIDELIRNQFIKEVTTQGKSSTFKFLWHSCYEGDLGEPRKHPCRYQQGSENPPDPCRYQQPTPVDISRGTPVDIDSRRESIEESQEESQIPPTPLSESEPLPEPPAGVDLEDVLILHRRAKGSKKPSAPDLRATTEWMADLGAEPGEMYAAMQAFLEDDYWREQKYPISAFRKHYSKYCQIAQERPAPPPPPATIADLPIVPQRRSQPAKPLVPGATPDDTDAFIAEWNAGPCEALRVRVVSIELRQALRSSLSNPKFRENWATLLQKAHTLRAQPGKEWLTLSLLLKGEKWARLLNGDYDWSPNAKPAPGAGTDALDRLIAASQQKAKAKEKTDRANN